MYRRRDDVQQRWSALRTTTVFVLIGVAVGLVLGHFSVLVLDSVAAEAYDLGYNDAMAGMYINQNSDLILQEFTVCD